ncbi:unnamed protein product [Caenorhabditis bovis]|uniref:Seven TM Receptor n=1 Tax=Caenorhabditis bovis TaxID=2654633 RepID=A0A8S1EUT1_9PELO|nr:unnamed protein product [Caenorhabditis bovis]
MLNSSHCHFEKHDFRNNILEKFDLNIDDIAYVGPYYFPIDENGDEYFNHFAQIGMSILCIQIIISLITVLYFGTMCYLKINELVSTLNSSSLVAKRLQSQLFNALVLQTIFPVALMHIPATFLFVAPLLDQPFEFASQIVNITIAIYPAIDALPTIFIVQSYRKATIDIAKKLFSIRKPSIVSQLSSLRSL